MKYTGPWQIVYEESFYEGNTKDPKFKGWFENHLQGFECAEFRNALGNTIVTYTKENGDWIEWQDYERWYQGSIIWYETVENATEDEIKAKVVEFESFSSYKDINDRRIGDDFKSQYRNLE